MNELMIGNLPEKSLPVSLQSRAVVVQILDVNLQRRKVTLLFDNDNWFNHNGNLYQMQEILHSGILKTVRQDANIIATKSDAYSLKNGIYVNTVDWCTMIKKEDEWQRKK